MYVDVVMAKELIVRGDNAWRNIRLPALKLVLLEL